MIDARPTNSFKLYPERATDPAGRQFCRCRWARHRSGSAIPAANSATYTTDRLDLVINIPKHLQREELTNDYIIRRTAVDFGIPLITNRQIAERLAQALERIPIDQLRVRAWREY